MRIKTSRCWQTVREAKSSKLFMVEAEPFPSLGVSPRHGKQITKCTGWIIHVLRMITVHLSQLVLWLGIYTLVLINTEQDLHIAVSPGKERCMEVRLHDLGKEFVKLCKLCRR